VGRFRIDVPNVFIDARRVSRKLPVRRVAHFHPHEHFPACVARFEMTHRGELDFWARLERAG
jgi:hypothetical protein